MLSLSLSLSRGGFYDGVDDAAERVDAVVRELQQRLRLLHCVPEAVHRLLQLLDGGRGGRG